MSVNKVVYGTTVLVDLTDDTVDARHLVDGYTATDKSGNKITGLIERVDSVESLIDELIAGNNFIMNDGFVTIMGADKYVNEGYDVFSNNGVYIDSNSMVGVEIPLESLGDARPEDIALGKKAITSQGMITGTMTSGGGSVEPTLNIESITATGGGSTSISFTGLKGQPKFFDVHFETQFSASSTRVVTHVFYDGSSTHGTWNYQSSNKSWGVNYHSTSYFTFTYSNGTLTVRSNSSTNGGIFKSSTTYRLTYGY